MISIIPNICGLQILKIGGINTISMVPNIVGLKKIRIKGI